MALCAMVVAAALTQPHPSLARTAGPAVIVDFSAIDEAIASRRLEAPPPLRAVGETDRPAAGPRFDRRPLTAPSAGAAEPGAPSLPPPASDGFYSLFPPPPPVPADAAVGASRSSRTDDARPAEAPQAVVSVAALPVARPAVPVRPRFAAPALRRPALQRASAVQPVPAVRRPRPAARNAVVAFQPAAPAARPSRSDDGEIGRAVRLRLPYAVATTELSPSAQDQLEVLARDIGGNDRIRLRLAAYANAGSGSGSAAKARRTSLARALAVRGFLIERGIKASRIDLRALGHTAAVAEADRVDVVVADK
jgi:outer membrane protein OmpA-like peptidoglycan-associated protein